MVIRKWNLRLLCTQCWKQIKPMVLSLMSIGYWYCACVLSEKATEELKRLILWSAAGWYQKHIRKRTNGRIPEWDSAETYFGMADIESLRWFLYQKSGCHTYTRNSLWSNLGGLYKLHPSQQKGNHKAVKGAVIIVEIIGDIHSAIDLFPGIAHIVIELFEEKEYTQIYSEKSIDMCFVEVML